ncbi:MAG: hypothetical protein FRX49_01628 [Trebouxia sp. A1-2]|nr:MAG: hypothetical protein FRX49_01628 [Trebouxia sp. A1-2]
MGNNMGKTDCCCFHCFSDQTGTKCKCCFCCGFTCGKPGEEETFVKNTEGGPARLPANQAHHGVHGHHAQPVATGVGTAGAPVVQQY